MVMHHLHQFSVFVGLAYLSHREPLLKIYHQNKLKMSRRTLKNVVKLAVMFDVVHDCSRLALGEIEIEKQNKTLSL